MIPLQSLTLMTLALVSGGPDQDPVLQRGARSWRPTMDFALAHKPFVSLPHSLAGYVDRKGRILNAGLAPSSYASLVLHRMRFGKNWLDSYNVQVHQWRGDRIAGYFGLEKPRVLDGERILAQKETAAFVDQGVLKKGHLYLFHVMQGARSHVGFVEVGDGGALHQSHFSGLDTYGKLADGDFRRWYRASRFRGAPVQFFHIRTQR